MRPTECPGCGRQITADLFEPEKGYWRTASGDWSGECPCGGWRFAIFNVACTAYYLSFRTFLKLTADHGPSRILIRGPAWMASDVKEYLATFPAWVFFEYVPSAEGEEVASIFEPQPTTSWKRLLDDAPAV